MTPPVVDLIVGARPNFIKAAAICAAHDAQAPPFGLRLVHTGQHYDFAMSGTFFEELGLPEPAAYLGAGGGTAAEQAAAIMIAYERVLADVRPALTLVVGDVTSTMACAIVARKAGVPVGHVEGGLRSRDWSMPEEVNRVVTDAVATWFYTTTEEAGQILRGEGVEASRIVWVGNTMIDTLIAQRPYFAPPACWDSLALSDGAYVLLTLHRPANVDGAEGLAALLAATCEGAADWPVVFPVHPRTAATLQRVQAAWPRLHMIEPLPYRQFGYLMARAAGVVTDSGGITEETTVLGVPCLTVRDCTERPETVTMGTNRLVGTNPAAVREAVARLRRGDRKTGQVPALWDGQTGARIVSHITATLADHHVRQGMGTL